MRKDIVAKGAIVGVLTALGVSAPVIVPSLVAARPTATPNAILAVNPAATAAPGANDQHQGPRGFGRPDEAVSDASIVAKVLGITEAEVNSAVAGGQTVADLAKAKGVDVQKVIDALVADKKDEIAAALKAGTITQAQADQQNANATQFVTDQVNGVMGGHGGPGGRDGGMGGHGGPGGLDADDLTAAATALGMTEADVTTALEGGKTLATLAKDKGVDVAKVIAAIEASDKAEFAAAVKAGTMTQAEADARLANLTAHVTDEVNGVAGGPGGPGGHGMGGRGHGHGPDGQGPAAPASGTNG